MAPQIQLAFILLIVFQVKHFICDFPLQSDWMVHFKTAAGWKFVWPLSAHCLIHAGATLCILLWWSPHLWWLTGVDFIAHFLMDRFKSSPNFLGRYSDRTRHAFWSALGFDQMVHHLTSFYIVWEMIR